eukprot:GHVU01179470.1.p1 GENE.GHVU01179470.1~~GHVU01179470.1.p1  ORF type:complete len:969 (+),score=311.28 GHVU01179470.1:275-3181(+)
MADTARELLTEKESFNRRRRAECKNDMDNMERVRDNLEKRIGDEQVLVSSANSRLAQISRDIKTKGRQREQFEAELKQMEREVEQDGASEMPSLPDVNKQLAELEEREGVLKKERREQQAVRERHGREVQLMEGQRRVNEQLSEQAVRVEEVRRAAVRALESAGLPEEDFRCLTRTSSSDPSSPELAASSASSAAAASSFGPAEVAAVQSRVKEAIAAKRRQRLQSSELESSSALVQGRVQGRVEQLTDQLAELSLEIDDGKRQLQSGGGGGAGGGGADFEGSARGSFENQCSHLRETQEAVERIVYEKTVATSSERLFQQFLDAAETHNRCTFCSRRFAEDSELETFRRNMSKRIQTSTPARESAESKLAEAKQRLELVTGLYKVAIEVQCKSASLEHLRALIEKLKAEPLALKAEGGDGNKTPGVSPSPMKASIVRKGEEEVIELLVEGSHRLRSLVNEHEELQRIRRRKEGGEAENPELRQLQRVGVAALKEAEEGAGLRVAAADKDLEALGRKRSSLYRAKDKVALAHEREGHLRDRREKVKELAGEIEQLHEELNRVKEEMRTTMDRLKVARDDVLRLQSTQNEEVMKMERETSSIELFIKSHSSIQAKIDSDRRLLSAEQQGGRKEGVDPKLRVSKLEEEELSLMTNITGKRDGEKKLREVVAACQSELAELDKNLELRKKQDALKEASLRLQELLGRGQNQNPEELRKQVEAKQAEKEGLVAQLGGCRGELSTTMEFISDTNQKVSSAKYRNVRARQRDCTIEHTVLQMAVEDLKTYHSELDKALMRFHSLKMTEINRTVKDLWQQTYKGADIEYIAIRSDVGAEPNQPVSGSRSYNYRVVMITRDHELEMRGRCSAGQKVLASLVVRLALAESFCLDCGILTLDEPTTNLDSQNAEALAVALADLIEARRDHANFQLLLITHDDEFVRMLARHHLCDCYFQVHKDSMGHSKIFKADMRHY